jgi:hypothetical protein
MHRMSCNDCHEIIARYAPEILQLFSVKRGKFPQGGNASMVVSFLNDHAGKWRDGGYCDIGDKLVEVAGEIIFRKKQGDVASITPP